MTNISSMEQSYVYNINSSSITKYMLCCRAKTEPLHKLKLQYWKVTIGNHKKNKAMTKANGEKRSKILHTPNAIMF